VIPVLLFALAAVAALFAWAVAGRRPHHRPIAWFLSVTLAADLVRQGLRDLILIPGYAARGGLPGTGWLRVAFHLEQALFVLWPIGIAALAGWTFLGRRPWPLLPVYVTVIVLLVLGYPTLRDTLLRPVYLGVELGSLCLALGCFLTWYLSDRPRTFEHLVVGLIVGLEAAQVTGGPYRVDVFRDWDRAWAVLLVLFSSICILEAWAWFRSKRTS
jgi:hypothetical protein